MRLIIAEKSIAAKRIAEILAVQAPKLIREGPVQIWDIGNDTLVIPLRGHILNCDFPKEYDSWTQVNLHQ